MDGNRLHGPYCSVSEESREATMLSNRLVRLIETHANELALNLAEKVQASEQLSEYRKVLSYELNARVYEIYHQLGNWLLERKEQDIEHRYTAIGSRRAAQGVPLSQLIRAIVLTKQNLWEFLKRESVVDNPIELFGQQELLELLDQFFDSAIYYAAMGYEMAKGHAQHEVVAAGKAR
jgi:light-regulated signal transduction histidine kinase (bacteriophytochrome)